MKRTMFLCFASIVLLTQCQENKIDEAFVTLNDKLTVSENALKDKSQNTYDLFDQKMVIP